MGKEYHVKLSNPTIEEAEFNIQAVGMNEMLGCTLIGPAGMGKTHMVDHTLQDMGLKKGEDYVFYGGHITLATIYEFLFENHDKLIFFDDCSQLVTHIEIMELLKQAMNTSGDRILSYRSKNSLKGGYPNEFAFDGRIIFAFNTMEKKNPNVQAIISRAPAVELKFNRTEVFDAMYKIAKGNGGGLMEYEKMIVTKEIENYTDSTMEVSLRDQYQCFNKYRVAKKLYGEGNSQWKKQVHSLFGKKKRSWIHEFLKQMVGDGVVKRIDFAKAVAINKEMSLRTAQRRIEEALEIEEIYQNKLKAGNVSIKPFDK